MNRSLGVVGTSFIGMGLVAILLLPRPRLVRVKELPPPFNLFDDDILFHPASAENKLVSETAALKAAIEAAKANQQTSSLLSCCGYDEIQYYPPGSENKLANQTEALKAARAAAKAAQRLQR